MKKTFGALVVAAFVVPLSVGAASDKASSTSSDTSGAQKMFQELDKNKDGFLSKDEVKGSPHEKEFVTLDKNNDGKLSREEHAAAPDHAGDKAATGATGGAASSGGTGGAASSGATGATRSTSPSSGGEGKKY
jgi:hypothetical protein